MKFTKGESGNPKGRPKGAQNKVTGTYREFLQQLFDNDREQFLKDWKRIGPKLRTQLRKDLIQFIVPKLASTDMQVDFDLNQFNEEQLELVIEKLINKTENG
jgi:type III secretory pathway component EscR